jgi:chaperone modulatory protein CbpM
MSLDEQTVVSRVDRVSIKELRIWVRAGWVRPAHGQTGPIFDEIDIARVRLLSELKEDMRLSKKALAVILPLLDRLHQTRRELRVLAEALQEQPEDVRKTVASCVQDKLGTLKDADADQQAPAGPKVRAGDEV